MRASFYHRLLALGAMIFAITGTAALAASEDDEDKPLIDWSFDAPPDDTQTNVLALGNDGTWSAKIAEGAYVVKNSTDKDAIRYVHLNLSQDDKPLELSVSSVDVDVEGTFEESDSGAGILYRFDPQSKNYLAFVLTNDGYMVLKRDKDGVQTVAQGKHPHDEAVTLEVNTLDSGELEFRLDDEVVETIRIEGFEGNDVGMISVSRGQSDFDNFQIYSPDAE